VGGHVGFQRSPAVEGVVALHVDVRVFPAGLGRPGRFRLHRGENLVDERVQPDRPGAAVADHEPLAHKGDPVVHLVAHGDRQPGELVARRLKVEGQSHTRRGPRKIRGIRLAFPGEACLGRADLEAGELKGGRIGPKRVDPLGPQVGVLRLPDQPTHRVLQAIQFEDCLGLDATHDRRVGEQVVKAHRGRVGRQPEGAAHEPVGHDDLRRRAVAEDRTRPLARHDQPIGPRRLEGLRSEDGQFGQCLRPPGRRRCSRPLGSTLLERSCGERREREQDLPYCGNSSHQAMNVHGPRNLPYALCRNMARILGPVLPVVNCPS
jgi:hypothetical protein